MPISTEPESTDPRGESPSPITPQRRSAAPEGVHPAGSPPIDPGARRQQGLIHDPRWIQAETSAAAETEAVAADLARHLQPGDIVLVSGDLGAGKTTFVRGACRALGVGGAVTSPSFTIARRYEGRVPVSHIDLYRLAGLDDEDPALLADELGPDRVAFVEWPEVGSPVGLDPERVAARVRLEHRGGDVRGVFIEP